MQRIHDREDGPQPDQATQPRAERQLRLIRQIGFFQHQYYEELMDSAGVHLECPDAPASLYERRIFHFSLFWRLDGAPVEVAQRELLEINRGDRPPLSKTTVLALVDRAYKHECTTGGNSRGPLSVGISVARHEPMQGLSQERPPT